jgi:hypothetical protein
MKLTTTATALFAAFAPLSHAATLRSTLKAAEPTKAFDLSSLFAFLEESGPAKFAPVKEEKTDDGSRAFLSITGLLHSVTDEDIAILEASALQTFEDSFGEFGRAPKSFRVRGAVEPLKLGSKLGDPCMYCPPDDDSFGTESKGVANILLVEIEVDVSSKLTDPCMYCPPDDDGFEAVATPDMDQVNSEFAKALCAKLQTSGSANFAEVGECAMNFNFPSTQNLEHAG